MAELVRSRIAPTPSGFLHIGNAYNFLMTEAIVRQSNGLLRLRIDDLDAPRIRKEYVEDIFESLSWLGIEPDEGPQDAAEQSTLFSQSLRISKYNDLLHRLVATGLVFACNCSRKDLQQKSSDGQYAGTCIDKQIPLDTPDVSWRLRTSEATNVSFHDRIMGRQEIRLWDVQRHFVIRRRDGLPAYHVASLYDDVDYNINTIVRGADLLTSTAAQLYLAQLLQLDGFIRTAFYHHPLMTDEKGEKLSKSAGSTSLKAMRESKMRAEDLRASATDWYNNLL
jgi:glutamyl-tRNA synthetase